MKLGIKLGALVGVSVLLLAGCSSSNDSKKSSSNHSTYTAKTSKRNTSSQQSNSTSSTTTAWNSSKNSQLASFMQSWGQTMGQTYTQYTPSHNVNFYGMTYPRDLSSTKLNIGGTKYTGAWSTDGKGNATYNVVAVYSDIESINDQPGGHLYFFAFHNEQPVVLISEQTNGDVTTEGMHFSQTQNADLTKGFNQIVAGTSSSSSQHSTSTPSSSIKQIDFQEASDLIEKGGFTDVSAENAAQFSDGSHKLANGGFEMDTYPGAKGKDIFTLTPSSDGTVKITAVYGTLDGGSFTAFSDQSSYGPSSATVKR